MNIGKLLIVAIPTVITLLGVIVAELSPLNFAAFCGRGLA